VRRLRSALAAAALTACGGQALTSVPYTTTRVAAPQNVDHTELKIDIFTGEDECNGVDGRPKEADCEIALPYVDRRSGEVHLGYRFETPNGRGEPMSAFKEQIEVIHQGTRVVDADGNENYTIIPHDPVDTRQLYVLVIDGSSSMAETTSSGKTRMREVKQSLRMPAVVDAFYPRDVRTGVILLQFTQGQPRPVTGSLEPLWDKADYLDAVKKLRVLSGYTHLYDAVRYATGPMLEEQTVTDAVTTNDLNVTVVALTDGFNNMKASDTCRDNARRLSDLLQHLSVVRSETADQRIRPNVHTVGLGFPYRRKFKLPDDGRDMTQVKPVDLCGKRYIDRRIDGDLETRGIDNASLAWIAEVGGGRSYVKQRRDGLGEAFRAAAAKRFSWFELRYRVDPFYLRRAFTTRLRLRAGATAEVAMEIHPSAWLDAPPGIIQDDGWAKHQSFGQAAAVLIPLMSLFVGLGFLAPILFNIRRAVFGRGSPRGQGAAATVTQAQPPGGGNPPSPQV
jgi:hypothetical protein